jgi:signal transduction histidine kinase
MLDCDWSSDVCSSDLRFESEKLEALSLLAAGVAHEIGNPLNSLHIHLQLLRRHFAERVADRELRAMLDTAKEEADRLHQVLTQFLAAIRAVKPDLTPRRLPPLVAETLHSLDGEIRDRGIAVKVAWPEEMPAVFGDAVQLRQAFYNILRNALQAMSGGGTLAVSARTDDDYVTLAFADTGLGIAPQDIGRIFEPYFTTKPGSGSGLGLMIVERIIRENGGLLAVDSVPGRGTTFRVRLPRASRRVRLLPAPAAEPEKKPPVQRPRRSLRKRQP